MDPFQGIAYGFAVALTPNNLLACGIGVLVGTLVGVLPGIGPAGTLAILFPVSLSMGPTAALIMFAGIYYGAQYGGSTTSILINTPGESASVITCLDGYELAKKGRAGPALGMAAIGSFVAGTISVIMLMMVAPPLAAFALSFGPPEYFSLMCMGLVMLTFLGGKSMNKALMSGALGLTIGTVGLDPEGGMQRFVYGQVYLLDGIRFIIVAMGLFAVSEVLVNAEKVAGELQFFKTSWRDVYPKTRDVVDNAFTMLRASFIGFFTGCLPGGGATVASFLAYATEKRISRHPERFGTGEMAGLVAPETANNSATGGAMVPLLTLGVPGTGTTAIMLGALYAFGLTPGPLLLEQQPDLFWGLIASMYIGNAVLLILNLPMLPVFAMLLRVPYPILYPFILLFTIVGVYSLDGRVFDVWLLAFFSVLGYIMKKLEFPAAPCVLALVLGPMVERSLIQSLALSHGSLLIFFTRPISAALMMVTALMLAGPMLSRVVGFRSKATADDAEL